MMCAELLGGVLPASRGVEHGGVSGLECCACWEQAQSHSESWEMDTNLNDSNLVRVLLICDVGGGVVGSTLVCFLPSM